ncbi:hypothetical protein IPZ58_16295 [Streptomyces roseoverticillatus]|uniref:hypothetical protein n=1 Tax=Streptomyces roseoverticillatus TaxID=66429 RepID=UPI001F19E0B3|nr:hypothetical protein [Streptomyces roseoverticillatus]MCF3103134.1 hypothetical protein [Streptomyces roseoverticillatus]
MPGIHFPDDCSDLDGTPESRAQYIQGILDVSGEDARHVMLYVTVSIGAIVLVLTQLPFERLINLPLAIRCLFLAGLVLMGAGALLFFCYVRAIHLARMGMVRCLASCDARHARQLWAGPEGIWTSRGSFYRWGIRLTGIGGALAPWRPRASATCCSATDERSGGMRPGIGLRGPLSTMV